MFKKILVATDASEYSRRALKTALELASTFGGEVELRRQFDYKKRIFQFS